MKLRRDGPEGLWSACEEMEVSALLTLIPQIEKYERAIRICYEAGVQAPTLKGKRQNEPDLLIASLFLKKALNDLRAAWVLLRIGYTSQAASVVASLYENALTVTALAGKPHNLKELMGTKSGDIPWSPQRLAKIRAEQWQEEDRIVGNKSNQNDFDQYWQNTYAGYKWLCKIKHPTFRSAIHDAASTKLGTDRPYVAMAAPDIRPEDLGVKAVILTIAINSVREALRSFVLALDCDPSSPEYQNFIERMRKITDELKPTFGTVGTLPFGLDEDDRAFKTAKQKRNKK